VTVVIVPLGGRIKGRHGVHLEPVQPRSVDEVGFVGPDVRAKEFRVRNVSSCIPRREEALGDGLEPTLAFVEKRAVELVALHVGDKSGHLQDKGAVRMLVVVVELLDGETRQSGNEAEEANLLNLWCT